MAREVRQVIKIDEQLCDGCGLCVPACAEGALQIIDGKAKMTSEKYCDGLGACLGECPQGAISFETREAEEFDEAAAAEHVTEQEAAHHHEHDEFVCPSAKTIDRTHEVRPESSSTEASVQTELRQWPVKLYLVNPSAPYFEDADLLIAADCVPFAYGGLHPEFLRGRTLVTGCPKFDETELYAEKLTQILRQNNIRSVTVLQMEVPCCSGITQLARDAVASSGKDIPFESVTITLDGQVKSRAPA